MNPLTGSKHKHRKPKKIKLLINYIHHICLKHDVLLPSNLGNNSNMWVHASH